MRYSFVMFRSTLMLAIACIAIVANADEPKRDLRKYKVSNEKVVTDFTKLVSAGRPKKVAFASNGSTFDLWEGGVEHLRFAKHGFVYTLNYLGTSSSIAIYQEASPERWYWYFYPDGRIFFYAGGNGPYAFDTKAEYLPRVP